MTLLDILIRLKNEAPTTLTVEEELHLQRIERRRERGDPLGAVLMEEGVTPETLAALQPDRDVMERAMAVLRARLN
jgi:hypothetical protein